MPRLVLERQKRLQDAAERLRGVYLSDRELRAFSAIEGEDIDEAR